MATLFSGECMGRATNPEIGPDGSGKPRVRWTMTVVGGPHDGKTASYSGKLDPEAIKWTKRDMKAIGWKGKSSQTFIDDVTKSAAVVPFTAEIAEYNGRQWTSAKFGGAAPLGALDGETAQKLDGWFAEVQDDSPVPF